MMGSSARGGFWIRVAWLPALAFLVGCTGHSASTRTARRALDAGRGEAALAAYNDALGVDSAKTDPGKLEDDKVLYLLDRAMVLQQLGRTDLSSRDLQIADKRIEVLDFGKGSLDSIGKYMFSDDTGVYQAPAYEKLLINTVNMMNYLARHDLNGARIEARRFAVMRKFLLDRAENEGDAQVVEALATPGSYLAGFTFERSKRPGEALRYYDEALRGAGGRLPSADAAVRRLSIEDPYRSPEISAAIGESPPDREAIAADEDGEILVVVNYGRVPPKIAKRVPIGLALTYGAVYLTPAQTARTNYLAAQGLVTWVNYPTLGKGRGKYGVPFAEVAGQGLTFDGLLAVDDAVRQQWSKIEGRVIASAITRVITRVVAGETVRRSAGEGVTGALLSLATQATLSAADTPDTRSWSTLPARIAVSRVRVPPGKHRVGVGVGGARQAHTLDLPPRGWAVVVLTMLR